MKGKQILIRKKLIAEAAWYDEEMR